MRGEKKWGGRDEAWSWVGKSQVADVPSTGVGGQHTLEEEEGVLDVF